MNAAEEKSIRVLLVEDNPGDVGLIRTQLNGAADAIVELDHVDRLSTALAWLTATQADVILLDLGLPDSVGLNTFRQVHERYPAIPILVMMEDKVLETAFQAIREGAEDYLYKGEINGPALVRTLRHATERKRAEDALRESEYRYRSLFEDSPVPLREEDFSGIKCYIDELRASGINDFRGYFESHPEIVSECVEMVTINDVNAATLALYGVRDKGDFRKRYSLFVGEKSFLAFREELVAVAECKRQFSVETSARTADGQVKDVLIRWSIPPGYEKSFSRVWVSVIDLTELRRVQRLFDATEMQLLAAQEIQQHLLPDEIPPIPGYDIAAASFPAEYAAGDYYDFIPLADGKMGFVVGDVTGHGFAPALLMAAVHTLLRLLGPSHADVGELLAVANRHFLNITQEDRFVTLALACLDVDARTLTYTSAGHPTGYVLDRDGAVRSQLLSTGFPMGVVEDADFPIGDPVTLQPGDLILLLTDGFHEARSPQGEFFGTKRILNLAHQFRERSAIDILEGLYEAVLHFSSEAGLTDDITAIVIKVADEHA
jgi:serine phosphatase RsbU (regulator of sigma subunit)/DNA-binding NarL/FixJ family response regulator